MLKRAPISKSGGLPDGGDLHCCARFRLPLAGERREHLSARVSRLSRHRRAATRATRRHPTASTSAKTSSRTTSLATVQDDVHRRSREVRKGLQVASLRLLSDADIGHAHVGRDLVRAAVQAARATASAAARVVRSRSIVDGVAVGSAERAVGKETTRARLRASRIHPAAAGPGGSGASPC